MISYDDFDTWGNSFGELVVDLLGKETVHNLASSTFEFIEDAGDFVVKGSDVETVANKIYCWLSAHHFCVFHGTRLLPEEIWSVRKYGLRPLVADAREDRLRKIFSAHPQWSVVEGKLATVIEDVGPSEKQGRREGQVHFSLSKSGLVHGFNHYLTHGSEFDQHVAMRLFEDDSGLKLLNSLAIPILVHVSLNGDELIRGANPYFSYADVVGMGEVPGLALTFLNAWAFMKANPNYQLSQLRTDCCLVQWQATPPSRVLKLEKLTEAELGKTF